MRVLTGLDYAVIITYLVLIFLAGIWFTRKASNSMEDFFLGGRTLPWWLIGVSMATTNFSIDTPVAVTKFLYQEGIAGVWFLWASPCVPYRGFYVHHRHPSKPGSLTHCQ